MHIAAFKLKRAFHRSIAFALPLTEQFGLTPARFDFLYVLHAAPRGKLSQSSLRRALGVCAMTISRMARRLEELGLVERVRCFLDNRQVNVYITRDARWRVRAVLKRLVRAGVLRTAYERAFGGPCRDASRLVEALYRLLHTIGRHFGDRSYVLYPPGFVRPLLAPTPSRETTCRDSPSIQ